MATITVNVPLAISYSIGNITLEAETLNAFQQDIYKNDFVTTFLNIAEFARNISYYHADIRKWETYPALYDDPHEMMTTGNNQQVNNIVDKLTIAEYLLKQKIRKHDKCRVGSTVYRVHDYIKDGTGVIELILRLS